MVKYTCDNSIINTLIQLHCPKSGTYNFLEYVVYLTRTFLAPQYYSIILMHSICGIFNVNVSDKDYKT